MRVLDEMHRKDGSTYAEKVPSYINMLKILYDDHYDDGADTPVRRQILVRLSNADYVRDLQRLHYEMLDTSRPAARRITTFLYIAEFSIVAWPSLQTLWKITITLVQH
jgi:hypothetical protein